MSWFVLWSVCTSEDHYIKSVISTTVSQCCLNPGGSLTGGELIYNKLRKPQVILQFSVRPKRVLCPNWEISINEFQRNCLYCLIVFNIIQNVSQMHCSYSLWIENSSTDCSILCNNWLPKVVWTLCWAILQQFSCLISKHFHMIFLLSK